MIFCVINFEIKDNIDNQQEKVVNQVIIIEVLNE